MNEIKCPNCGKNIEISDKVYLSIVGQVKKTEIDKEVKRATDELKKKNELEKQELELKLKEDNKQVIDGKDSKISELERKINENEIISKQYLDNLRKEKEFEIKELELKLKNKEKEKNLAVVEAKNNATEETIKKYDNLIKEKDKKLADFDEKIKEKDNLIDYYKDYRAKLSTKMVGESLEQHCLSEFESLRMTGFQTATFEKDNDISSGTKGDFIFRDYSDGIEYISIMFEMKNENETTATKHKNEDFFKKLDKDRKDKKCEYAVLVSLLEMDNDYYNNGIVDVSYKYEKMYVVRPQFFIPIITLLRNAAKNTINSKKELSLLQGQNIDIVNFENAVLDFKTKFSKNYENAKTRFKSAIEEIDKTIKHLEKIKEELTKSENQLKFANDKVEDLTIKKLTKNSPSLQREIDKKQNNN